VERTVDFQGRKVQGTEVGFDTMREERNEYALSDGSTIKVKTVLTSVVRLNGEHDPQGDPVYLIRSNSHVVFPST
jgi:hypothetical protein